MKAALPTFLFLFLFCLSPALAAPDMYLAWATSKWGTATTGSVVQRSVTWGEEADPDRDGIANLIEYACDTDPTRHNPASDCWQFFLPDSGAPEYRYPQITAHLRTDDPDLRVLAQTSQDLAFWSPQASSVDFSQPQPENPAVWEQATGSTLRGLRQMRYIDRLSMAQRSRAFMRLHVVRRFASASTTPIEPFAFTPGQTVATGSTALSSSITLAGFAGTLSASIPAGVTLFVNGTAQTGSSATVKAGDVLWMQATAPGIAGLPRNYTLTIGSQSATWSFTAGSIAAVPDHPGTDSGYTPVETGVSDTGAAQISIPIVVAPGTGGMQPKLSINYSSQGGNGPLGVGFSLSGLSTISRVGRTVAQDGVKGGVNFDANDRFALDGQRLIAINGADGADGTEYRLEFDPTTRIKSIGSDSTYSLQWAVTTKAGLKLEFGFNGRARPEFSETPIVWGVERITDTLGNTITVTYDDNGRSWGELLVTQISYTSNSGVALNANQKVIFEYENRPDMRTSYFAAKRDVTFLDPAPVTRESHDYVGRVYSFDVTGTLSGGDVWGTDVYSTDSNIARAAVHAGQVLVGQTKRVTILITEGRVSSAPSWVDGYQASSRNGVTSRSRPSWWRSYEFVKSDSVGGVSTKVTQRLKAIESQCRTGTAFETVRRYELSYKVSSLSNTSLLTSVAESSPGGPIQTTPVAWMDGPLPAFTATRAPYPPHSSQWHYQHTEVGDFNGDGKSDLFSQGDDGKLTVMLRKNNPDFTIVRSVADKGFNRGLMWLGDFDGDGLTDVLTRPGASTRFVTYFSNGDGTFRSVIFDQSLAWDTGSQVTGDFDGDGRTDVLAGIGGSAGSPSQWRCFLSNGDGTFRTVAEANSWNWNGGTTLLAGDFNGDGTTDLLSHNYGPSGKYAWVVMLSDRDGTFTEKAFLYDQILGNGDGEVRPVAGDFNGDGITDVMGRSGSNLMVFLFDGMGGVKFVKTDVGISGFGWRADAVGNFNSDRMTDMMSWLGGGVQIVRIIAKGDGVMEAVVEPNSTPWDPNNTVWVGDFDGDGKADIVSSYFEYTHFTSSSSAEDLVATVSNGHGGKTQFSYKSLTDSAVYTKGTGSSYPCAELQPSLYVVSSVASRNGIDGDGFTPPPVSPVGENTVSYRYEGAWSCLDGRGFMGFKAVETTDATSGIITRTVYESSSPLLGGRTKHTEQRLSSAPVGGSALISESDTSWNITTTANAGHPNTYFVTEASSTSKAYEVNRPSGSALVKTATRNGFSYDGYGNLLTSTTTTTGTETFTETVTNTYADAPTASQWHLGRLATSSVTKTGPNPAGSGTVSLTRSSSFAYHPTTGLLTQEVIEPTGGTLRQQKDYTHDGFGNILTSTISTSGAASRTTTTTYTPDGRFVATTTNAEGHTESKTYDPLLGNVVEQTGPNGLTTRWFYDAIGRPIREERPDGTVTRSFYRRVTGSTVGAPPRAVHYVRVQSSGSAPKTVWYDLLDREIKTDAIAFDGRTVSVHKVFNNRGEVTHASQPYFAGDTPLYSTMLYDAVGREYQQTDPGNRVTKTTYDGLTTTVERNYNPAALTDFQKAVTVVNAMGWTVQSSQYLGTAAKTITRKYDPYGNLRFVTDPANNTTELRYDVRGNKTWMSEPNSGTSTFTYNGFGELKTQTNAASQTTTLAYDRLGRVTSRTEPEGVTTFTYDTAAMGIGQLAREAGPGFERRYFYDALARPAATAETHGFHVFSTSRGYDLYSRPESVTYPSGFATRQVYNASGHLSEVQNGANPSTLYWRALQVNARGQVTQEALGNGIVTERAFEAETGIIQGITSTLGSSGDVQKLGFTFDLIGNLTERRDKRFSTHFVEGFGYDTLNRLQTVSTTGAAAVSCAYNDLGNLTSRSDVGTLNYASSGAGPHALTSVTGSSGGALNKTCGYDLKGNRTTDGGTVLDYSSFNKPTRIRKGGDTLSFDYGPDRALYRQTIFHTDGSGATSQTVREYIGGLYEREITSEGLVRHIHHIAGGNGVVAIHTDERSAASAAQRTRFIHKDHLGSVDAITDSNGVVVERQSYDAWGRRRTVTHNAGTWTVTYPASPGSAETHRGFTGHEMLDLVGLVHMGGRIYDPITARFLSPDPFVQSPDNLQNLNRYSYVLNNPLSYTDPSGFFFKKLFKTVAKLFVQHVVGNVFGSIGFMIAGPAGFAAGYGFGSAFSGTLLAGGSVGDALRAGLVGGVSARLTFGIGTAFESKALAPYSALKPIVHGVAQGGIRAAQGGKFAHGFMSAAFASQFAGVADMAENAVGSVWAGRAVAAVVGGTAEAIGGGKFGNGAMTGAFVRMFNDDSHQPSNRQQQVTNAKGVIDGVSVATTATGLGADIGASLQGLGMAAEILEPFAASLSRLGTIFGVADSTIKVSDSFSDYSFGSRVRMLMAVGTTEAGAIGLATGNAPLSVGAASLSIGFEAGMRTQIYRPLAYPIGWATGSSPREIINDTFRNSLPTSYRYRN